MAKAFFFKILFVFFYRILFRKLKSLRRSASNIHASSGQYSSSLKKCHKFCSLSSATRSEDRDRDLISNATVIFNVERSLLRSSSLFPYFMLVAFEAGGLFRSLILFGVYPIICLLSQEMGLKVMVIICFFGIKKESFRVGTAVLPKFYLEEVGKEMFEVLQMGKKRVALTNLPLVMVESFLKDYLQIDVVVGRELKVCGGYYVGLMEDQKTKKDLALASSLEEIFLSEKTSSDNIIIGITDFNNFCDDHHFFSHNCKDVYLVSKADKRNWENLPRENYPKPLIFHDGRLAFRPTPLRALQALMWGPFGFTLAVARVIVALSLPYDISLPILAFSGLPLTITKPKNSGPVTRPKRSDDGQSKGLLYVCNHRTLLDPLYLCFALKVNLTALTYSLSRMSEILAPIRTVRLTRNRDKDSIKMEKLLNQGDLVVCPEGTTCREPYLLRFSPLFSEIADEVVPVAVETHVSMFHGTTAGGLKCLDPLFFLMNPSPIYTVQILDKLPGLSTCRDASESRFHVANQVQGELGKALGYECTKLTRRDKYLILAGNEGMVTASTKSD